MTLGSAEINSAQVCNHVRGFKESTEMTTKTSESNVKSESHGHNALRMNAETACRALAGMFLVAASPMVLGCSDDLSTTDEPDDSGRSRRGRSDRNDESNVNGSSSNGSEGAESGGGSSSDATVGGGNNPSDAGVSDAGLPGSPDTYTADADPYEYEYYGEYYEYYSYPYVDVEVLAAIIAPAKADGCMWDGISCNEIDPATLQELGSLGLIALGAPAGIARIEAVSQLVGYATGLAIEAGRKPDPFGQIELSTSRGTYQAIPFGPVQDSFRVPINVRAERVPLDERLRVRLNFADSDLEYDDPIGSVVLGEREIVGALYDAYYGETNTVWIPTFDAADPLRSGVMAVQIYIVGRY